MLRIAVQSKGRLFEDTMNLLAEADIKISSKIWGQFILLRAVIPALRNVIIGLDPIISCMRLPHQVWQ